MPLVIKAYPPAKPWSSIYKELVATTFLLEQQRPTWIPFRRWPLAASSASSAIVCAVPKSGASSLVQITTPLTVESAATQLAQPRVLRYALLRHPLERFVSWYNDKILGGCVPGLNRTALYNKLLLNRSNAAHAAFAPIEYARAVRDHGTAHVEPHLRSATRTCLLGVLHYDVIGRLEDTAGFLSQIEKASGVKLPPLPHENDARKRAAAADHTSSPEKFKGIGGCPLIKARDLDTSTVAALEAAYEEDFLWFERLGVPYRRRGAGPAAGGRASFLHIQ